MAFGSLVNILLNIFLFRHIFCLRLQEFADNDLSQVAKIVSSKYFSGVKCIIIITENNKESDNLISQFNLPQSASRFLVSLDSNKQKYCDSFLLKIILGRSFEEACINFIVHLTKPACFFRTWKIVAKESLHRHNPRIMFLPTIRNKIISSEILKSNETNFILEVLIIDLFVKDKEEKEIYFEIVTLDWNSKRKILANCEVSECEKHLEYLMPNKIANLHNKVLKVATFNYPPYSILNPLDGTEIRIISEYARIYNCSIEIVTDDFQWGQINESGSGSGILGNVAEEKADIGLGAIYLWFHEYQFLDFSVPYIRTGITCLAPKPNLLSTSFLPIRPFRPMTWLIVFSVLVIACIALYLIKKVHISLLGQEKINIFERHHLWFTTKADTVLRTFGFLVLQASSNCIIETTTIRHLVNCLHITFLLIAASYSSGLASILTVPSYQPPVDTVADLLDSQLNWGATHDAWIFSLREASETQMKTLVSRFRALPRKELHKNSVDANFAFSIERLPAGHFAVGDYITEESLKHLRLMKQDIYFEHCIFVFQKGSPYMKSVNRLIQRLSASGILLFWEGEVARKFLHTAVQSAIRDSTQVFNQAQLTPILLSHLQGAFIILCVGLALAILSFIVEISLNYYLNLINLPFKKKVLEYEGR